MINLLKPDKSQALIDFNLPILVISKSIILSILSSERKASGKSEYIPEEDYQNSISYII